MAKKSDAEKTEAKRRREIGKKQEAYQKRMRKAWDEAGCPAVFEFEGETNHFMTATPGFLDAVQAAQTLKIQTPKPTAKPAEPEPPKVNVQELQARALQLWFSDQQSAMMLGIALQAVKDAMPKGTFHTWWKAKGLEQSRVSYCLRVAQNKVGNKPLAGRKRTGNAQAKSFVKQTSALFATQFDFSTMFAPERELLRVQLIANIDSCKTIAKAMLEAPPAVAPVVAAKGSGSSANAGQ